MTPEEKQIIRLGTILWTFDPEKIGDYRQDNEYDSYAKEIWNLETFEKIENYIRAKEWPESIIKTILFFLK
jgi:hypothetical protein